jgi:hypothetical protein
MTDQQARRAGGGWGPRTPVLEFLLARLLEDREALAVFEKAWREGREEAEVSDYLAHFDLRRTRADIDARFSLIMLHRPDRSGSCRECVGGAGSEGQPFTFPCPTLVRLLWPYQHHPDIDADWGAGDRPPPL